MPVANQIELIRKYILLKSGITNPSPGDCKQLSELIKKATGKLISETTLKRFLGFAKQDFKFSKFTLNALCEYAGFFGWEEVSSGNSKKQSSGVSPDEYWNELKAEAAKSTNAAMSYIKNFCGIPFDCTQPNNGINIDFDYFMKSNSQLYCLSGYPNSGKTIQVAHIIENFFLKEGAKYLKSIPLLIKSSIPFDFLPPINFAGEWHNSQNIVGTSASLIENVAKSPQHIKGHLVIIIDGIEKQLNSFTQSETIFNRIVNLLLFVDKFNWIKVVLSLRMATWTFFYQKAGHLEFVRQKLWKGIFNSNANKPVIRLFSNTTSKKILYDLHKKLSIPYPDFIPSLSQLLKHPYYIQLYYKLLLKKWNNLPSGYLLYCELIRLLVKEKVQMTNHNIEKNTVLYQFVKMANSGRDGFGKSINRLDLINQKEFSNIAYQDLLNDGVLQENYLENGIEETVTVSIFHDSIFYFFVAQEIISKEKNSSAFEIVNYVEIEYPDNHIRKMLLLWIFLFLLSHKKESLIELLSKPRLTYEEKLFLLFFSIDFIVTYPKLLPSWKEDRMLDSVVKYLCIHWMEIEWTAAYGERILWLLLEETDDKRLKANELLLLGVIYSLKLEKKSLQKIKDILNELCKDYSEPASLSPVKILDCTFHFFLSESYPDHKMPGVIAFINKHLHSFPIYAKQDSFISWLYLIIFQILKIKDFQYFTFGESLEKVFISPEEDIGTSKLHQMIEALNFLKLQKNTYSQPFLEDLEDESEYMSLIHKGSVIAILYEYILGLQALAKNNLEMALHHFKNSYREAKSSGFVFVYITSAIYLIKIFEILKEPDKIEELVIKVRNYISGIDFPLEKMFEQHEFFEL